MTVHISHDHRPGPLTRLLVMLVTVLIAFALFGLVIFIWVVVVLIEDPATQHVLGALAGVT